MFSHDHAERRGARVHARRRRRALGAVALVAACIGAIVGSGANDEDEPEPTAGFCERPGRAALAEAAGQSVVVRMEGRATPELLARARRGAIGGVVLFPPAGIRDDRLAASIARVQAAALSAGMPALLVAIDQEGGIVERLPALAPQTSPYTIGQNDDARDARLEGRAAGFQLGELGINVNLAPVLDVPAGEEQFMAPRAFGFTPEQVTRLGLAFAAGMRSEGMAATAKHFPGLGHAVENTDLAPTTVTASAAVLRRDIAPFAAAVEAGFEVVMVSSAAYPALGAPGPAVLSPALVTDLLRGELGFDGVIVSDDLHAPAIRADGSADDAAVAAARAGVDLMLFASRDTRAAARALVRAVEREQLDEAALRASCARVVALKEALPALPPSRD